MAYPMPSKNFKPAASVGTSGPAIPASTLKKSPRNGSWLKGLVTLVIVLVIIGGGIYLIADYTGIGGNLLTKGSVLKTDWQAVFLSNGQVYFVQVEKIGRDFLYLKDIYYLQVVTLQDANTIAQPNDVQTQPEQRLTLIKLGNEIHGPADEMMINRDQIVLIEDLKDDSRVVQAINDYLAGKTQPAAQQPAN